MTAEVGLTTHSKPQQAESAFWQERSEEWARRCGWKPSRNGSPFWMSPDRKRVLAPSPSFDSSIDALLASLPADWEPDMKRVNGRWHVGIDTLESTQYIGAANSDTCARALLLACLSVETEKRP